MVAQRLVEIHGLQDRRVEAGEQFGGHNQNLQRVVGVTVAVEQPLLGIAIALVKSVARILALLARHRDYHVAHLFGQMLVKPFLEEQTAFLVIGDDHAVEAVGRNLLQEVGGDVGADAVDALRHLDQHRHARCGARQRLAVQVGETARQFAVGAVDGFLVDV